jgi:antitoxin (DNA-binding transcriptional repressor) of toxin-antitoxin stability system
MQIGVRELREKLSEIVNGNRNVVITNNGRVVGEFMPAAIVRPTADREKWLKDRAAFRQRWQAETPDWHERLESEGMDEEGELFAEPTFR